MKPIPELFTLIIIGAGIGLTFGFAVAGDNTSAVIAAGATFVASMLAMILGD